MPETKLPAHVSLTPTQTSTFAGCLQPGQQQCLHKLQITRRAGSGDGAHLQPAQSSTKAAQPRRQRRRHTQGLHSTLQTLRLKALRHPLVIIGAASARSRRQPHFVVRERQPRRVRQRRGHRAHALNRVGEEKGRARRQPQSSTSGSPAARGSGADINCSTMGAAMSTTAAAPLAPPGGLPVGSSRLAYAYFVWCQPQAIRRSTFQCVASLG